MLDKYNLHSHRFRFLTLGKLQRPRKHHRKIGGSKLLTGDDTFY
jgi:hypothetical protein